MRVQLTDSNGNVSYVQAQEPPRYDENIYPQELINQRLQEQVQAASLAQELRDAQANSLPVSQPIKVFEPDLKREPLVTIQTSLQPLTQAEEVVKYVNEIPGNTPIADEVAYINPVPNIQELQNNINLINFDPVAIQEKINIAKEVIPELINLEKMDNEQFLQIIDTYKQDAITKIVTAKPETNIADLENITNVVELTQISKVIENKPELEIADVQVAVQKATELSVARAIDKVNNPEKYKSFLDKAVDYIYNLIY